MTDDPEPTDPGRWEILVFATGEQEGGVRAGGIGMDINYGIVPDVQLNVAVPATIEGHRNIEIDDVELAVKVKFIHQTPGNPLPDVSFYPRIFLRTSPDHSRASVLLPLWAQKNFGPWSLFGGGGIRFNPGAGNRNVWIQGIGLTRRMSERVTIGAEVFHEARESDDERNFTGVTIGINHRLGSHHSLLLSVSQGLGTRRTAAYAAIMLDL